MSKRMSKKAKKVTYELKFVRKNNYGDEVEGPLVVKDFDEEKDFFYYAESEVPTFSPKYPVLELQYRVTGTESWGYRNYRYLY